MRIVIFYAWQSDSPKKTNMDFIQEALDEVALRIQSSIDNTQIIIDRDTSGISGSPDIIDTILKKISKSHLFVGDLTITSPKSSKKHTPNPNVVMELGYAASKLGWDKIICIMNEEFGGPTKLFFDFKNRRWPIRYRLSTEQDKSKISEEKRQLVEKLENAIRLPIEMVQLLV